MICSSVKRLLRIVDLLAIDSTIPWRDFRGAGHPKTSGHVDQFVKAFFERTIDGYLSMETHPVESKKIRSAMVRILRNRHDEETRAMLQRLYITFSGYVHANYAHIMEVYGGTKPNFNLAGVPSIGERQKRMEHVESA